MLDSVLKNIVAKTISKCVGLTVIVDSEETIFQAVILEKSKSGDLIPIDDQLFTSPISMKAWIEENVANVPVLWGIEGRQVLTKILASEEAIDEVQLIKLLLPNAKENDFVINAYFENQQYYCSLIRREAFDEHLKSLRNLGLNLYQGFVGPIVSLTIREHLLDSREGSYQFGYYQVEETNGFVLGIRKSQHGLSEQINDQYKFSHRALNAFSGAVTFFTGVSSDLLIADSPKSAKSATEYTHKRVFKPFFTSSIIVMLVLFLGNAYFYMDFRRENEVLEEKSSSTQLLINNYEKRRALFEKKDKIVKSLNYNNTGVAWISDQIAQIIPSGISLNSLVIDPVSKDRKQSSPFDQKEIHLSGNCEHNIAFGKLISELSQLSFMDEISYQQYQYNKTTRKGEFEIKLKYKTD